MGTTNEQLRNEQLGKKRAAHNLGSQGEADVAAWYEQAGYRIVARNWRCFEGELDLVAVRGRTIVICEVKARTGSFMDPTLSIGLAKQRKVRTAAFRWLEETKMQGSLRFDVALVIDGRVQVIEGAF